MTIEDLKSIDKNFNESMFISKVNNIFIKLLSSVMFDNLKEIDHFIGDDVYNKYNQIIEDNKNRKLRQFYDELNVKNTEILNVEETNDAYLVKVKINARYMDYKMDENGKIKEGHDEFRIEKPYMLTLSKNKNARVQGVNKTCPKCGATVDVNNNGICEFCRCVFSQENYDWVLIDIR